MKSRFPQIVTLLILAVLLSVSLPASYAKYIHSNTYNFELTKKVFSFDIIAQGLTSKRGKDSAEAVVQTGAVDKSGYYAVIAKGGNGSKGMYTDSNELYGSESIGGYVYSCIYLDKGDSLQAYLGNAGGEPSRTRVNGQGGINGFTYSYTEREWELYHYVNHTYTNPVANGGAGNNIGNLYSKNASGGGGAATLVFKTSASGDKSLITVAGGAGANGSGDDKSVIITSVYKGESGAAGGNMSSSHQRASGYLVYNGLSVGTPRSGGGGSISGGSGGYELSSADSGTAMNLTNFSGGSGGAAAAFGGGGGGGFAGGGGAAGNGASVAAGAGGGGSSAIILESGNKTTYDLDPIVRDKIVSASNFASSVNFNENAFPSGGFVIIAYVGEASDSLEDFSATQKQIA